VKQSKQARHKNVTLSLPESLLRRFRVYAAQHNRSMTSLMADAINTMVNRDDERERLGRRFLDRIRKASSRGTGGKITWTREELYRSFRDR
jgi:plasmid stability protein